MRNHNRAQHPTRYRTSRRALDRLAHGLLILFALERLLKLAAAWHFFHRASRKPPPMPQTWPTVTLLQPITRGATHLSEALHARAALDYPASLQHLLICDSGEACTQQIVARFLDNHPDIQAEVVLVEPDQPPAMLASKMHKLQRALPGATGEVLCFMDDDVTPRPDALRMLIPYLSQEGTGVAFGLLCFTSWHNTWSSLVSLLINAHMLLNFMAVPYLTTPFRINAQVFAFRRDIFERVGGFDGLEQQIDDEFEIARRVRQHGLRAVQTPLIYDVRNDLSSAQAYSRQFKRWFVMPRQAMLPSLGLQERLIFSLLSFTLPFPSFLALLALWRRNRVAWRDAALSLALFGAVYALCERRFLERRMPLRGWLFLPVVAFWTPLHILWLLLRNSEVEWRGQRLRLHRDGRAELLSSKGA